METAPAMPIGPSSAVVKAPPQELRRAVRFSPENLLGTLTWSEGGEPIKCNAIVLDISGGGAAMLADRAPGMVESIWVRLETGSTGGQPIEALPIAISDHPSGKTKVRLRFTTWLPLEGILGQQRERRFWQRYPARETRGALIWHENDIERSVACELVNISGGGAAVIAEVRPPDAPFWFELKSATQVIDPVESRLVEYATDPSGSKIARLCFLEPCSMALFELAVHGGL
jgi:hypothetical protein